uniref:Lipoprotein n=1 Tax=Astatotilapia calliptera TaxID=8154 RepID=A0AAX7SJ26_ASTCA
MNISPARFRVPPSIAVSVSLITACFSRTNSGVTPSSLCVVNEKYSF